MTTENQQTQTDIPLTTTESTSKPRSRIKKILLIIGIVIAVFAVVFGLLIFKGFKDKPLVEAKVVEYMQLVSNQEFEKAYNDIASERFKAQITLEKFIEATELFEPQYSGFQKLEFASFSVRKNSGAPTIYEYSGIITYSNGDKGELSAFLEQENGEYKIDGINVKISPERAMLFR